jgi:hypothetical protein
MRERASWATIEDCLRSERRAAKIENFERGECGEEAHSQIVAFILERVVRHEESDFWPSIEPSGRTRVYKASAPNRFETFDTWRKVSQSLKNWSNDSVDRDLWYQVTAVRCHQWEYKPRGRWTLDSGSGFASCAKVEFLFLHVDKITV